VLLCKRCNNIKKDNSPYKIYEYYKKYNVFSHQKLQVILDNINRIDLRIEQYISTNDREIQQKKELLKTDSIK
jgi:hypothetical protein